MTNTTNTTQLTQDQFTAAQDVLDARLRNSKRGTPERALAEAQSQRWEQAIALPQRTVGQREFRLETIALVAAELGLVVS